MQKRSKGGKAAEKKHSMPQKLACAHSPPQTFPSQTRFERSAAAALDDCSKEGKTRLDEPSSPTLSPSQLSINKIDTGVPKLFVSHLGSPGPHSARYRLVQDRLRSRRKPDTVVQSKGRISESSVSTIGFPSP